MLSKDKNEGSPFLINARATLELMRPANIVTAFADILAGVSAAAGILILTYPDLFIVQIQIFWLLIATFGLYGGGVVFNDVFDANLDADERPERAIPSGRVSKTYASILGSFLLLLGIFSAYQVNESTGLISIFISVCALFYDAKAKHYKMLGPLFMGSCRGGNLMLGVALFPETLTTLWPLALIPVIYIAAITLISQDEIKGGSKITGIIASGTVILITAVLLFLAIFPTYNWVTSLPFTLFFGVMVIPPFIQATNNPLPENIQKAVKRGVLSLIILNSAIAAGFSGLLVGVIILLLLPLSILLAKIFAVT